MTTKPDTFVRDRLPPRELWPVLSFAHLGYPERLNAADWLVDRAIAEGHGARPAIVSAAGVWSYERLLHTVDRIAWVLQQGLGVRRGNRVLLRGANGPLLAASILAVWRIGAIAVPTMPLLRPRELEAIIEKAKIGFALVDCRHAEEVKEAAYRAGSLGEMLTWGDGNGLDRLLPDAPGGITPADTAADDPALILFTSGTTGQPKAAVHMHRDLLAVGDSFARHVLAPTSTDVLCGSSSLAFAYGLCGQLLIPLRYRASVAYIEKPAAAIIASTLRDAGVTLFLSVPTLYRALLDQWTAVPRLRLAISAGERLMPQLARDWLTRTRLPILDGLGSTELLNTVVSATTDDHPPGSFGRAVPGYAATLLDDNGRPTVGPGSGRLAVRGPTGARYLDDLQLQRAYVQDGWNVTGDLAERDEHGRFHHRGRTDELIVTAGYSVSGTEIEAVLHEHPWVRDCAVIGAPDAERGTIVKTFVVPMPGVPDAAELTAELQTFVRTRLAPWKCPRVIVLVEALPRTATGKLQRTRLHEGTPDAVALPGQ